MANALNDAKKLAKYNNELEQSNVKLQYDYNRSLAQEDRSWQERMANSAHQREIADLKAAGLNPVLSVTGGNGSATPAGSATSVSKPNVDMSLPRAVMDMAIAQLNSATNLQMTAMNNANAFNIAQGTWANNIDVKKETSGDSVSGQIRNLGKNFVEALPVTKRGAEIYRSRKSAALDTAMTEYLKLTMQQATTDIGTKQYRKNKRMLRKLEKRIEHYQR